MNFTRRAPTSTRTSGLASTKEMRRATNSLSWAMAFSRAAASDICVGSSAKAILAKGDVNDDAAKMAAMTGLRGFMALSKK